VVLELERNIFLVEEVFELAGTRGWHVFAVMCDPKRSGDLCSPLGINGIINYTLQQIDPIK